MRLSITNLDGIVIVGVFGAVDGHAAGRLYDVLVECIVNGTPHLIVDLSGVHLVTRAGVRGLIVAAKLAKPGQAEMQICSAKPAIQLFLQSLGFNHLLKFDRTLEASLTVMSEGTRRAETTPAVVAPANARPPEYAVRLPNVA